MLAEVDALTGFTDYLTHAGARVTRPAELKRNLLYVIIAEATNMGLGAMAESCGVPYDVLAWTAGRYFRPETLEVANAAIVNYHHRCPVRSKVTTPSTLTCVSSSGSGRPEHQSSNLTWRIPCDRPRSARLATVG